MIEQTADRKLNKSSCVAWLIFTFLKRNWFGGPPRVWSAPLFVQLLARRARRIRGTRAHGKCTQPLISCQNQAARVMQADGLLGLMSTKIVLFTHAVEGNQLGHAFQIELRGLLRSRLRRRKKSRRQLQLQLQSQSRSWSQNRFSDRPPLSQNQSRNPSLSRSLNLLRHHPQRRKKKKSKYARVASKWWETDPWRGDDDANDDDLEDIDINGETNTKTSQEEEDVQG